MWICAEGPDRTALDRLGRDANGQSSGWADEQTGGRQRMAKSGSLSGHRVVRRLINGWRSVALSATSTFVHETDRRTDRRKSGLQCSRTLPLQTHQRPNGTIQCFAACIRLLFLAGRKVHVLLLFTAVIWHIHMRWLRDRSFDTSGPPVWNRFSAPLLY